MRRSTTVLATALLLVSSACSYTFAVGPGEKSLGGAPARCSTSRVPPIADTVIAVASAVAAGAAMYACASSGPGDDDQGCIRAVLLAPPAIAGAILFGASAHRGYEDSAACAREPSLAAASR